MRICNGNKKTGNLINSEDFKGQHLRGESLKRKRSSDSCKATSDPLNCNKSKPNQLNSDKEENTTFQGNQSTKQHEEIGTYFIENLKSSVNKFHQSMQYFLIQCSLCYEAWPLITKPKSCKSDNYICRRCKIDKETPKKFSANSMIPSPLPAERRKHGLGWKPSYTSVLCRSHFEDSCFKQNRAIAASLGMNATLKHNAIPTLDNANEIQQQVETPLSSCQRKKVLYRIFAVLSILSIYKHAIHSSTLYLYTPCNSTCATLTL